LRLGDTWHERAPQAAAPLWTLAAPNCGTACEAAMLQGVGAQYERDEIILAFSGGNELVADSERYAPREGGNTRQRARADRPRVWMREHARAATFAWVYMLRGCARIAPPGVYSAPGLQSSWPPTEAALAHLRDVVGTRPLRIWYIPAIPEWDNRVWSDLR